MILGVTGTSKEVHHWQQKKLKEFLVKYTPTEVVHGCCVGADERAELACKFLNIPTRGYPGYSVKNPEDRTFRSQYKSDIVEPEMTHFQRNRKIVEVSDHILGIPLHNADMKGGTWYTINYAIRQTKPVTVLTPYPNRNPDFVELVTKAETLAYRMHVGQKYGDESYHSHLDMTVAVLIGHGITAKTHPEMIASAYLHDAVEDTSLTIEQVFLLINYQVGKLVEKLTNVVNEGWVDKVNTYKNIASDPYAIMIKIADRAVNVHTAYDKKRNKFLERYKVDYPLFRQILKDEANINDTFEEFALLKNMWYHLDYVHGFVV